MIPSSEKVDTKETLTDSVLSGQVSYEDYTGASVKARLLGADEIRLVYVVPVDSYAKIALL